MMLVVMTRRFLSERAARKADRQSDRGDEALDNGLNCPVGRRTFSIPCPSGRVAGSLRHPPGIPRIGAKATDSFASWH
jgi:hypothetical protein